MCAISVGMVSAAATTSDVPAARAVVKPSTMHEDRHEQDPAAVGEQPGEEPGRRDQRDHRAGPVAARRAPRAPPPARAGTTIRTPDAEEHHARSATRSD